MVTRLKEREKKEKEKTKPQTLQINPHFPQITTDPTEIHRSHISHSVPRRRLDENTASKINAIQLVISHLLKNEHCESTDPPPASPSVFLDSCLLRMPGDFGFSSMTRQKIHNVLKKHLHVGRNGVLRGQRHSVVSLQPKRVPEVGVGGCHRVGKLRAAMKKQTR